MKRNLSLFLLLIFLVGCNKSNPEGTQTENTPTPGLATPVVQTTQAPDVETAAMDYMNSWKENDFLSMYSQLSLRVNSRSARKIFPNSTGIWQ